MEEPLPDRDRSIAEFFDALTSLVNRGIELIDIVIETTREENERERTRRRPGVR